MHFHSTIQLSLLDAHLSAVFCGLTLHLLFNKHERTHLPLLERLLLVLPLVPSYILLPHYASTWRSLLTGYSLCYTSLISSIVLYRISPFHPLSRHPGPFFAKCSKFWSVYQSSTGKMHITFLEMHRQYGPVVRTGPNELSFCDMDAIQPVLGADGLAKGPIWDGRRSPKATHVSLLNIRNVTEHLQRRKPWNRAFTTAGVRQYEPILQNRLEELVECLSTEATHGKAVDLAEWISFFTYDFMGDMAFGGGFNLMREGDTEGLWQLMERGIRVMAYSQHVPWAVAILYSLPGMGSDALKLRNFAIKMSQIRLKRGSSVNVQDLSFHLLDEGGVSKKEPIFGQYLSDAFLAIVAGSDTVATVLSSTLFYLLSDKSHFLRLREEVDSFFPPSDIGRGPQDDMPALSTMPFLNAVINESLRLQPPLPTGLQRSPEPGSGGKLIGSTFVSEGTAVYIAPYVIHRDERYFSPDPERFWPDRWLPRDDSVNTNPAAFLPFSIGPMNCVGKLLAQMELRVVLATLVQRFDMDLKEDWPHTEWENELKDFFVFSKGSLPVIIKARS